MTINYHDEFAFLDATAQAALVQQQQVTPLELVDAAIARIEALQPSLNFMASNDFERAREQAKCIDTQLPFAGVPILLKDTLSYPGAKYANGSRLFAQFTATDSSPYLERLIQAGFIILGKSTTPEFALLGMTESKLSGRTHNPWNTHYSPAGSSGGSACAVAAGAVPIAHASDGGGSIRIPASACGLFGFKPSRGRNVADTLQPMPVNFVEQHCVSRSVRDSAKWLSITENTENVSADASLAPLGMQRASLDQPLRIGYYTQTLMGHEADPAVKMATDEAAALCESLGHHVEPIAAPALDGEAISRAFFTLAGAFLTELEQMTQPVLQRAWDTDVVEPFTLSLTRWFAKQPSDAVEKAVQVFHDNQSIMQAYFQQCDVALSPTMALPVQPIGVFDALDFEQTVAFTERFAGFTPVHNQAGVPGMSVPLYWGSDGLPIGSHFAAAYGNDARLFQLAYQLEQAKPWAKRQPSI